MEQASQVNVEANKVIQDKWDSMAEWYETAMEKYSLQGTTTCAVMTNVQQADRVLEVACGPGNHSLMLAQTFLKNKGVLVSCDFSGEMVKKVHQNYSQKDNDYVKVEGNKFLIDIETNYNEIADESNASLKNLCDLDKLEADQGDFRKFVFGC